MRNRLDPYFPRQTAKPSSPISGLTTVPCPTTGRPTPLAPDFWLAPARPAAMSQSPLRWTNKAVRSNCASSRVDDAAQWGSRSTYKGGAAESIWTGETFSGDYIRTMTAQHRMGRNAARALCFRVGRTGSTFSRADRRGSRRDHGGRSRVARRLPEWEIDDLVPTDAIDSVSNYDRGHRMYGIDRWSLTFSRPVNCWPM